MRASSGTRAIIIIQSSRNKTLLRTLRPISRVRMMTSEKAVAHHDTSTVGQLASLVRGKGGVLSQMAMAGTEDDVRRAEQGTPATTRQYIDVRELMTEVGLLHASPSYSSAVLEDSESLYISRGIRSLPRFLPRPLECTNGWWWWKGT